MEFTFDSVPTAFGTDIGWSCSALAGGGNYQGLPRDQTASCRNGVLFRREAGIALRLPPQEARSGLLLSYLWLFYLKISSIARFERGGNCACDLKE